MNDDAWIEELLKQRRLDDTLDDGFTQRLVARLPARRSRPYRWIVPVLSLLGAALAVVGMRDTAALDSPSTALAVADFGKTHLIETPAAMLQNPGLIIVALAAVCVAWIACVWALFATQADG